LTPSTSSTPAAAPGPSRAGGAFAPAIALRHFSKTFGPTTVLKDVSLTLRGGEVWGLLGENGSGKSTLIKILAGFHSPDPGAELEIDGADVKLPLRGDASLELGLAFVHQDLGLFPKLSIVENFAVTGFRESSPGMIHWRQEARRARRLLDTFEIDIDPRRSVGSLSAAERAMLAIVRAAGNLADRADAGGGEIGRGTLVLDEPTVFLPEEDSARLYELVHRVAGQGAAVLLVSHHLAEVRTVTDHVAVLRDGVLQGTWETANVTDDQIVEAIVGRAAERATRTPPAPPADAVARVAVSGLRGGRVRSASFEVRPGEILGVTGLVGSGFEDVPKMLFGAEVAEAGSIRIGSDEYEARKLSPRRAMEHGVALIPGDRLISGGVAGQSTAWNLTLPTVSNYFRGGHLQLRRERREAAEALRRFSVRPPDPYLKFGMLSGGNQQKLVLAKWLRGDLPQLLVLHEPTQGVDVGARMQVYDLLAGLLGQGLAMLCASTDFEQLEQICSRVIVFRDGEIGAELNGSEVTEERMATESYGESKNDQKRNKEEAG
jgi:ribose transport system ATP-binding protein